MRLPCYDIIINDQQFDKRNWAKITKFAKIFCYKSIQAYNNKISGGIIPKSDIIHISKLDFKLTRLP